MRERAFKAREFGVFLVTVLIVALSAAHASAQYMFLDTDGNGISGAGDSLSASGATVVTIYLVTNQDRSGNPIACSIERLLTVNSYEVILRSVEGQVDWGTFTNLQSSMSNPLGTVTGTSDYRTGFVGGEILPAGKYRLGTLTVTPSMGSPRLEVVPSSYLSVIYGTSFGSSCLGQDADNTLKLGVDWFDVDGCGPPSGPAELISLMAPGPGTIVLGGNVLEPPYRLTMVKGHLTVNGFSFPAPPKPPLPALSTKWKDDLAATKAITAVCDSLRGSGHNAADIVSRLQEYVRANPLVSSVTPVAGDVRIRFRSGFTVRLPLSSPDPVEGSPPLVPPRASIDLSTLQELQGFVHMGGIVFIVSDQFTHVVSPQSAQAALVTLQRLRDNTDSSGPYTFPEKVRAQLASPARLVREQ